MPLLTSGHVLPGSQCCGPQGSQLNKTEDNVRPTEAHTAPLGNMKASGHDEDSR